MNKRTLQPLPWCCTSSFQGPTGISSTLTSLTHFPNDMKGMWSLLSQAQKGSLVFSSIYPQESFSFNLFYNQPNAWIYSANGGSCRSTIEGISSSFNGISTSYHGVSSLSYGMDEPRWSRLASVIFLLEASRSDPRWRVNSRLFNFYRGSHPLLNIQSGQVCRKHDH